MVDRPRDRRSTGLKLSVLLGGPGSEAVASGRLPPVRLLRMLAHRSEPPADKPLKPRTRTPHMEWRSARLALQAAVYDEGGIVTDTAKGRILVVEDEAMISMLVEDILEELGYALTHALQADIDVGLLDINVKGQVVFPAADVLEFRGIPFIFATGYGDSALPERFLGHPTLSKPFALAALG